ncbi:MAG TPA: hypothetical protein VMV78_06690 [Thiobacillus sp.]|jgi:hypothetical protein|nr:hypothetical protein [Thiobacillus sp.]
MRGSNSTPSPAPATAAARPAWYPDTGEVLGVLNSVSVKGAKEAALSAPSGISYAIPVKYVHRLLEQALPETK